MTIIENLNKIPELEKKVALTIGNFEGYHLGHRKIVDTLKNEARKRDLLTCIITFRNHPLGLLKGFEPERLWSRCDKIITFYREGIDLLIYLNFSEELAYKKPYEFLDIIRDEINPSLICLGETFKFGRKNMGNISTIEEYGKRYNWEILPISDLEMFGNKVSSTLIRSKIKTGDFKTANAMLGRKYSLYLKALNDKKNKMELFLENMAAPINGVYRGELIDLDKKDCYSTTVKFKEEFIEIVDYGIIKEGYIYSFNFDSNQKK